MRQASIEGDGKQSRPKRIRRWAKRPADPNVHLVIRELEGYLRRIEGLRGRDVAMDRRLAQKLVAKLYQVRWS